MFVLYRLNLETPSLLLLCHERCPTNAADATSGRCRSFIMPPPLAKFQRIWRRAAWYGAGYPLPRREHFDSCLCLETGLNYVVHLHM